MNTGKCLAKETSMDWSCSETRQQKRRMETYRKDVRSMLSSRRQKVLVLVSWVLVLVLVVLVLVLWVLDTSLVSSCEDRGRQKLS